MMVLYFFAEKKRKLVKINNQGNDSFGVKGIKEWDFDEE